ncbi:MAG TPA: hypothetical protein VEH06_05230 [Candidatus Bathyarchaeia archaeon]|nr:hypothetical protein [Candidatus Bathyarchaeia archaeon]
MLSVCSKLSQETALLIGEEIWKSQRDIRDVVSVGEIIKTLAKYGYATG